MEKEVKNSEKKLDGSTIWKPEHTPLNERTTSSGLTFRYKAVKEDGERSDK